MRDTRPAERAPSQVLEDVVAATSTWPSPGARSPATSQGHAEGSAARRDARVRSQIDRAILPMTFDIVDGGHRRATNALKAKLEQAIDRPPAARSVAGPRTTIGVPASDRSSRHRRRGPPPGAGGTRPRRAAGSPSRKHSRARRQPRTDESHPGKAAGGLAWRSALRDASASASERSAALGHETPRRRRLNHATPGAARQRSSRAAPSGSRTAAPAATA